MDTIEIRRAALAERLAIKPEELEPLPVEGVGSRFQLLPGGFYHVFSLDEEKQAFKTRVPDVPFVDQVRDAEGRSYNVYLVVGRSISMAN